MAALNFFFRCFDSSCSPFAKAKAAASNIQHFTSFTKDEDLRLLGEYENIAATAAIAFNRIRHRPGV
jgi:hypothetical protein